MFALRAKTASLLLDRISEQDRITVIRDVTRSLDVQSSNADIGLAAALWRLVPDPETQTELVSHLRRMIERDDSDRVAAICRDHVELEGELLTNAIPRVMEAATLLRVNTQRSIIVPMLDDDRKSTERDHLETLQDEMISTTVEQSRQLLGFLNRILSQSLDAAHATSLLQSCLVLVGASDKQLSQLARETLFSLFTQPQAIKVEEHEAIWKRIESLVTFEDAYYKSLGFSLWLRWLSHQQVESSILKRQKYWDLIVDGLRKGDSERRKSALQILRASINASLADSLLTSMIVADSQETSPAPEVIQKQYNRFASTFETIVLGRYLNQVMECEPDLDFLSSSQSVVRPVFLYTLLASALDQKLQDSNRKFIGTWIMRSNLRTDDADEFMAFFRNDFLPWVTAGTLFTSSLGKPQKSQLKSQHGDDLARYVSGLVQNYPQRASGIIDCILDGILARHGNNFAYRMVYLVEGIARALETSSEVKLTTAQLEKLHKIATYAGLPEVVRDYALARSWKLCFEHVQSHPDGHTSNDIVASAAKSWAQLLAKSEGLGIVASTQNEGNIASIALAPSKREANEQIALQKCRGLVNDIGTTLDAEKLDDIWSDLEYLEYPKGLLAALPDLMLHPEIVKSAISADSEDNALMESLARHIKSILELAGSRSYLLAPLVGSIRTVALRYPESSSLLDVNELIIYLAGHPPAPTMDAMLEEATINLLQPIDSRTEKFSYEFYSGRRESYGFAALIDLASRLDVELSRQILDSLLHRWVKQKTPAPAVSHWKTSLQLQMMLLCSEQVIPTANMKAAGQVLEDLHYILSIEPLPTYRYLMEWMIARVYIHHPTLRVAILEKLSTKDHHSNPKFLASLMKLGVMIAKTDGAAEEFALHLATAFVPLAASSKVVIRHEAQWQVPILLDHARKQGWKSVIGNTAFEALDEFIRSLERFEDPPLERQIDRLDPIKDHNLTHLVSGSWWALDQVEQPLCRHADFLELYENDAAQGFTLPASCIPLGPPPKTTEPPTATLPPTQDTLISKTTQNINSISQTLSNTAFSTPALQTKGAAYLSSQRTRHSDLLVIASLVDNPYNLGGLSRVSEIFGAGSLYVQNPTVTSTKDFLSVSVSSHHHIPILPLSAEGIQDFVAGKKKEEGFSVVGIEQTDRSNILGEEGCDLPRKCILVLGSEREGIPAGVLSECDVLVEIGQVGVTRSLNVQTAAGIVLNEYARQFRGAL